MVKIVKENIEQFKRKEDPKKGLKIGKSRWRNDFKGVAEELSKILNKIVNLKRIELTPDMVHKNPYFLYVLFVPMTPVNVQLVKIALEEWIYENTDFKVKKMKWRHGFLKFELE